jgi:hypothetical protein
MPKSAEILFLALQKRFIKLDRTSAKVALLHSRKSINGFDVEQIYSGVYLDAFVSFERFIEDLFLGYVSGELTSPSSLVKLSIGITPAAKAEQVILAGKNYIDWIPYDTHTKKRAAVYFKDGIPFSTLNRAEMDLIILLHQTRNALAHRSAHSMEIFSRLVVGDLAITPSDRRPARFLLTIFRAHPKQTRLQNYLFEMLAIAKKLSA